MFKITNFFAPCEENIIDDVKKVKAGTNIYIKGIINGSYNEKIL